MVGVKGTCEAYNTMFWLDDIPGIDLKKLANVAEENTGSGEKLAVKLIEGAARFMAADVEAIYDAQYKVQNQLVGGCSSCKFTTSYSAGAERGILIKNNTTSSFSQILLDKLIVKINSSGTYTIIITDGEDNVKQIEQDFTAGYEYEFANLNYRTKRKNVKVYFQQADVLQNVLSCPRSGSGCGCSGTTAVLNDLTFSGLTAGAESQSAYGFLPCAMVICDAADLLCFVANSAPRMIGMAMLYKTAELYFATRANSGRNNKVAGVNIEEAIEDAKDYQEKYQNKLVGVGTRGVKDLVFTTLQQTNDVCIVCNSLNGSAWATG